LYNSTELPANSCGLLFHFYIVNLKYLYGIHCLSRIPEKKNVSSFNSDFCHTGEITPHLLPSPLCPTLDHLPLSPFILYHFNITSSLPLFFDPFLLIYNEIYKNSLQILLDLRRNPPGNFRSQPPPKRIAVNSRWTISEPSSQDSADLDHYFPFEHHLV
jgi:hypothetical protein